MLMAKKIILGVALFILLLVGVVSFVLYSFIHVDLDELNGEGKHEQTVVSPNEEYQADMYVINKGGATVAFQGRVSITSLTDDKKEFDDETIYWIYPLNEKIEIEWEDEDTIVIHNETIDIHDPKTYYNWKEEN